MTTELHGCGQTEEGAVMAERCGCDGRLDVKLWPGQAPTPKKARVPKGGTAGQVLTKRSDADGDTEWTTPVEGDGRYVRLDPPGAYGHKAQEIQGILIGTILCWAVILPVMPKLIRWREPPSPISVISTLMEKAQR